MIKCDLPWGRRSSRVRRKFRAWQRSCRLSWGIPWRWWRSSTWERRHSRGPRWFLWQRRAWWTLCDRARDREARTESPTFQLWRFPSWIKPAVTFCLVNKKFLSESEGSLTFGPMRFKYCPYIGEMKNTTSSKMPNTRPYSVAFAPFFSASCGKNGAYGWLILISGVIKVAIRRLKIHYCKAS